MNLASILSILGIAVAVLSVVGGLLYFVFHIWFCALAQAKGGGSARNRARLEDAAYKAARHTFIHHRDRAGRGVLAAMLGCIISVGLAWAADRLGGSPAPTRTACPGVEHCE